jgi:hypothetical protein
MWGIVAAVVIVLAVGAWWATVPCHLQEGWVRAAPEAVMERGKAAALFLVARRALRAGARSFNYQRSTRTYELFRDYMVNFTMPADGRAVGVPAPAKSDWVTGVVVRQGEVVPMPCCEKIKCEMRAHGLDPDGKMARDWDVAGPYYDVERAAKSWPTENGAPVPPAKGGKSAEFIDQDLTAALKAPGALAPGAVVASQCSGACDFCSAFDAQGRCINRSAQYWKGCGAQAT